MVGKSFMDLLEQRNFPISELRPFASDQSVGKKIKLKNEEHPVQSLKSGCFDELDLVFFSSGDEISQIWAPQAVESGAWAIDNSAAFRMDSHISLVVPEVNGDLLNGLNKPQIIANPNCSTIQMVVVLDPLYKAFGMSEVRVASYQAVSGAGQAGYEELLSQTQSYATNPRPEARAFAHPIAFNCIPQIGSFNEFGFSSEEMKIMKETKKIMRHPNLKVSAFTVRVPVLNAHAEAVWVTLDKDVDRGKLLEVFQKAEGLVVEDDPKSSTYPLQNKASGQDPVYLGRIHRDLEDSKTWLMWIVADNIRKGAALNGIQIAERIFDIQ